MHIHKDRQFKVFRIIPWIILGILGAAFLALIFGLVVMFLWNWLMPQIFGLTEITYWQAWGLVLLAQILFKGGHHHSDHRGDSRRHHDVWREKFHEKFGRTGEVNLNGEGENEDAAD